MLRLSLASALSSPWPSRPRRRDPDRPSRRPERRHLGCRRSLRPRGGRCPRLREPQGRHQGREDERRDGRLRLPGAACRRALQEVDRRARQGRGDPGLGHRRHRGAVGLRHQGRDPVHLRLLRRAGQRPDRRQRQGQGRALQLLLRPVLLGCASRHADVGRRRLEGQGQDRQAEIRPYGRQPPLPELAQGSRRGDGEGPRLRGAAGDRLRAGPATTRRNASPPRMRARTTPISAIPAARTSRS